MLKEILLLTLLLNCHEIVQGKPASSEIQDLDETSPNFVNVFTEIMKEIEEEGNLTENDWTKCFKGLWSSMVSKFKAFQNKVEEGFKDFVKGFKNFVKSANNVSYPFYHR